jgi:hypothetical protein
VIALWELGKERRNDCQTGAFVDLVITIIVGGDVEGGEAPAAQSRSLGSGSSVRAKMRPMKLSPYGSQFAAVPPE